MFRSSSVGPACALLASVFALVGCRGGAPIVRVLSGDLVVGHEIAPDAYAAVLAGSLLERDGRKVAALLQYRRATDADARSAVAPAAMARVLCALGLARESEKALAVAMERDPASSAVAIARATCAATPEARFDELAKAAASEPLSVDLEVALAEAEPSAQRGLSRIEAALLLHRASPSLAAAGAALALSAGRPRRAAELALDAARLSPSAVPAALSVAERLADRGALIEARALSAGLVDGVRSAMLARAPRVALMAVDEAVLSGDARRAAMRATRVRLSLATVAGRALLWRSEAVARELLPLLVESSPGEAAAVQLALGESATRPVGGDVAPAIALAVLLRARARASTIDATQALALTATAVIVDPKDTLLVRAKADLARSGAN